MVDDVNNTRGQPEVCTSQLCKACTVASTVESFGSFSSCYCYCYGESATLVCHVMRGLTWCMPEERQERCSRVEPLF